MSLHPDVSQYCYAPVLKFPVSRVEVQAKSRDLGDGRDTKIENCLKYKAGEGDADGDVSGWGHITLRWGHIEMGTP